MGSRNENTKSSERFPLLKMKQNLYLDFLLTSNGADTIAKRILAVLKHADDVSPNLINFYKQRLWGNDPKVKRCLHNRMYAIKRLNKQFV